MPSDNVQYRPLRTLSLTSIISIALVAILDAGHVVAAVGQIISPDIKFGAGPDSFWTLLQGLIAILQFPLFIIAAVFFLIWLNRAYTNLLALRPQHLEFSSGWAVGWWFVPFCNLIKPFQVVREVWAESDPEINEGPSFLSMSLHQAPTYMGLWWAFWIIMNISSNIAGQTMSYRDASSIVINGYLFIFAGIVSIIAAILVIYVVRDVTSRQELRFSRLGNLFNENLPPPPPTFYGHDQ